MMSHEMLTWRGHPWGRDGVQQHKHDDSLRAWHDARREQSVAVMSALRCTAGHWCVRWQPIPLDGTLETALDGTQSKNTHAVLMVHMSVCGWPFINNEKEAALTTTRPGLTLERAFVARSATSPMAGHSRSRLGSPKARTPSRQCRVFTHFRNLHTGGRCHEFFAQFNSGRCIRSNRPSSTRLHGVAPRAPS